MSKINYLLGLLKHISNNRISNFALIDNHSIFHSKAKIYRKVKIVNSHINAFTYIAPNTEVIHASIGKYCSIGRGCQIGLPIHALKSISTSPIFSSRINALKYRWIDQNVLDEFQHVLIGNDVWIGNRAIVMGGIRIGHGAVIGAGTIVTKDIPDYAIAVGVPARIVKYRFDVSIVKKLLEIQWWDLPESFIRKNIQVFNKENLKIEDLEFFYPKSIS